MVNYAQKGTGLCSQAKKAQMNKIWLGLVLHEFYPGRRAALPPQCINSHILHTCQLVYPCSVCSVSVWHVPVLPPGVGGYAGLWPPGEEAVCHLPACWDLCLPGWGGSPAAQGLPGCWKGSALLFALLQGKTSLFAKVSSGGLKYFQLIFVFSMQNVLLKNHWADVILHSPLFLLFKNVFSSYRLPPGGTRDHILSLNVLMYSHAILAVYKQIWHNWYEKEVELISRE